MRKAFKSHWSVLIIITATIVVLVYWIWMLHVTQLATNANTVQRQEKISDVKIQLAHHRGTDKLRVFTSNGDYILDTGWRNNAKSSNLANQLLNSNSFVTITIWNHFPKWIMDSSNPLQVQQIVDIRSNSEVYWDIATHNNYQQSERISGCITGFFLLIMITPFVLLWYITKNK